MPDVREDVVALGLDRTLEYGPDHVPALRRALGALLARLGLAGPRPLAGLVRPGDTVVVKPNLVYDRVSDPRAALTNGSVVQAVCDLVLDALAGRGRVVIADVPLQSARFDAVVRSTGLDAVMAHYRRQGAPVELLDLRQEYLEVDGTRHRGIERLPGDPLGYAIVNVGAASELEELGAYRSRFAVGDYDQDSTAKSHMSSERNEYLIPRTILAADVLINVPKLKTHKKAGITCALKNLVGICGHKSYLPHFREGRPRDGGDEFAIDHAIKALQRATIDRLKTTPAALYRAVRSLGRIVLRLATWGERADLRRVMGGSWHGNDTLWRTILDLNKIARYADRDGQLHDTPQRRYLCIVDGVYSGENDGPILPDLRHDGLLLAGMNPLLVDLVVCLLMGVDPAGIKQVRRGFDIRRFPLAERPYGHYRAELRNHVASDVWPLPNFRYRLAAGWEHHVPRLATEVMASGGVAQAASTG
jgi:uncharacterized protein (DUF362 family)